jgi:SHAQKYF class myb-like DNA-binding protein
VAGRNAAPNTGKGKGKGGAREAEQEIDALLNGLSSDGEDDADCDAGEMGCFGEKPNKTKFLSSQPATCNDCNRTFSNPANLRTHQNAASQETDPCSQRGSGWTTREHDAFIVGLNKYGRKWKKVSAHMQTRTSAQISVHSRAYFAKLEGKQKVTCPECDRRYSRRSIKVHRMTMHQFKSEPDDFGNEYEEE